MKPYVQRIKQATTKMVRNLTCNPVDIGTRRSLAPNNTSVGVLTYKIGKHIDVGNAFRTKPF